MPDPAPKPRPAESDSIAAGTRVEVELSDVIDSETTPAGTFIHALVISDVKGKDGRVAVPLGSSGIVVVMNASKNDGNSAMTLALYQLTIGDKSFLLNRGVRQLATLDFSENASKGQGHRSIHVERRSVLKFAVAEEVKFKS